ncbi:MAG: ROK family transcriptional regulator [Eubacteriales bacterium]|nr:ROK family transcriptional regulator [Eubacteriales bacterium]
MGYTGINLENVKLSNRSAILKLLNDQGAMPRKDIAVHLGLTPATVTMICTELLSAGILCEKGEVEEEKRAGRRKVLVDINYRYRYVLSISIEGNGTCVSICDLKGNHLGIKTLHTDVTLAPGEFLKKVSDESKALMWESGIGKDMVLGAGVSIPGPVSRREGISRHAYRIWNEPVPVGEILRKLLDVPVIVENNVKAFAEGELIYGEGKLVKNMLLVKWGPGVGSAIIIQNRIYDSQSSKTAEIGHCLVEKNGKLCSCGRRGCLETMVSSHAIAEQVREACTKERMPLLYDSIGGDLSRIQVRNIGSWMSFDDPGLERLIGEIMEYLLRIVVNSITLLAPERVVLYGYLFELPGIRERFVRSCAAYDPAYDGRLIIGSKLSGRQEYIGGLAVVMNELFLMSGYAENTQ